MVVIGDTPRDVEAALAIGAQALGVATGRFAAADLRVAGATFVFDDLAVAGAMAALRGE